MGTTGHVVEDLLAPDEPSSAIFGHSKKLEPASCESVPLDTGRLAERTSDLERDPQNSVMPTPRFARKFLTWNPFHAEGTHRQNCTIELPRNLISDLHFDEFPDPLTLQCWNTNFKTDVCSCSVYLTHAMLWIKEVEVAQPVDDLMTSQSSG